jgi:hypothetical protein
LNAPVHAAGDGGIELGQVESLFQTKAAPKTGNPCNVSPDRHPLMLNVAMRNVPFEWTARTQSGGTIGPRNGKKGIGRTAA